jgi:hypothetical protein
MKRPKTQATMPPTTEAAITRTGGNSAMTATKRLSAAALANVKQLETVKAAPLIGTVSSDSEPLTYAENKAAGKVRAEQIVVMMETLLSQVMTQIDTEEFHTADALNNMVSNALWKDLPPLARTGEVCGIYAHALFGPRLIPIKTDPNHGGDLYDERCIGDLCCHAFASLRPLFLLGDDAFYLLFALGLAAKRLHKNKSKPETAVQLPPAPPRRGLPTESASIGSVAFDLGLSEAEVDLVMAARTGKWPDLVYDDPLFVENAQAEAEYTPERIASERAQYMEHRQTLLNNLRQAMGETSTAPATHTAPVIGIVSSGTPFPSTEEITKAFRLYEELAGSQSAELTPVEDDLLMLLHGHKTPPYSRWDCQEHMTALQEQGMTLDQIAQQRDAYMAEKTRVLNLLRYVIAKEDAQSTPAFITPPLVDIVEAGKHDNFNDPRGEEIIGIMSGLFAELSHPDNPGTVHDTLMMSCDELPPLQVSDKACFGFAHALYGEEALEGVVLHDYDGIKDNADFAFRGLGPILITSDALPLIIALGIAVQRSRHPEAIETPQETGQEIQRATQAA